MPTRGSNRNSERGQRPIDDYEHTSCHRTFQELPMTETPLQFNDLLMRAGIRRAMFGCCCGIIRSLPSADGRVMTCGDPIETGSSDINARTPGPSDDQTGMADSAAARRLPVRHPAR